MRELQHFREMMAQWCEHHAFPGSTDRDVARHYAQNEPRRRAVIAQFHAAQRGQTCDQVIEALREARYPGL